MRIPYLYNTILNFKALYQAQHVLDKSRAKTMNKYTYLETTSSIETITGNISWISGLICFMLFNIHISFLVVGAVLLFLGVNLLSKVGIEIDLNNRSYRKVTVILGITFGNWKSYPTFKYLTMFRKYYCSKRWRNWI